MTTPTVVDALVSEREWSALLVDLFGAHGWLVYRTWSSLHSPAGYPDLTLVHPTLGIRFVEAKAQRGKLTPSQEAWLIAIRKAGGRAHVLRPADFDLAQRVARGEE